MRHFFATGITSRELSELIALNSIDPYVGGHRGDLRAGLIAAVVMNSNPFGKKGREPVKPESLVLYNPDAMQVDRMEPQQIMNHLKLVTKLMGGTVNEKAD